MNFRLKKVAQSGPCPLNAPDAVSTTHRIGPNGVRNRKAHVSNAAHETHTVTKPTATSTTKCTGLNQSGLSVEGTDGFYSGLMQTASLGEARKQHHATRSFSICSLRYDGLRLAIYTFNYE